MVWHNWIECSCQIITCNGDDANCPAVDGVRGYMWHDSAKLDCKKDTNDQTS